MAVTSGVLLYYITCAVLRGQHSEGGARTEAGPGARRPPQWSDKHSGGGGG